MPDFDSSNLSQGSVSVPDPSETSSSDGMARETRADAAHDTERVFHVVGVGASAGGLEALESFFHEMPTDTGAAFVVIQHLSPDFKSHMEQLLARQTALAVIRAEDRMVVEPNSIYLIPPKKEMIISGGKLVLSDKDERGLTHPIDTFFRSLANDRGKLAAGVVLSGTGSDGSRGIVDIHDAGGLVIAQTEDSAQFDGMPLNAQETGVCDLVLPPRAIAAAVSRYVRQSLSPSELVQGELPKSELEGVQRILQLLRAEFGIDFGHYKPATVARRVNRRLELSNLAELPAFVSMLQEDRAELNNLYKDLLIGVTRFFRDTEAFEQLEEKVIPEILSRTEEREPIRVWVAGCATGEEAYSIAMLFHEQLVNSGRLGDFKMFATDVHRESIQFAAAGIYPEESLGEVSDERRKRYFRKQANGYQVAADLRQMIVFAPHNVISDAPFTQLHLVTCRNLLIYLQPQAQKKALSLFHFALRMGGTLLLGPSETPGPISEEFEVVNRRWKIYKKRRDVRLPPEMRLPLGVPQLPRGASTLRSPSSGKFDSHLMTAYDRLLGQHMPPSFLVDEDLQLVHTFGGAERFLQHVGGRTTTSIVDLVHPDLKTSLSGALQHALKEDNAVRYTGIQVHAEHAEPEKISLVVEPLLDPRTKVLYLIIKLESLAAPNAVLLDAIDELSVDELTQEHMKSLEVELRFTRENLQATIEELETSNEELQATNEELVASNEELQSTNEELQSVNEELYTVNTEHQKKIEELSEANYDMDNLLETTRVGVLFLDRDLCIRRFTPEIAKVLDLLPHDIGRKFTSFARQLHRDQILDEIVKVRDESVTIEAELSDRSGHPYAMRIVPYLTRSGVEGVVVTLIDIASIKEAQRDVSVALDRYRMALRAGRMGAWEWELHDDSVTWSDELFDVFGVEKGSFEPSMESFLNLIIPEERDNAKATIREALASGNDYDLATRVTVHDEIRCVRAKARIDRDADEKATRLVGVCWDETEERQGEERLSQLASIVENSNDFIGTLDSDLRVVLLNPAARRMLGLESDDSRKLDVKALHTPESLDKIQYEAIPHAIKHGTWTGETSILSADGKEIPVSQSVIAHLDEQRNPAFYSTIARDISRQRNAGDRLAAEHAVTHILAEEHTPPAAVERLLPTFVDRLHLQLAEFWEYGVQNQTLTLKMHAAASDSETIDSWIHARSELQLSRGHALAGIAWNEEQPAWMTDVSGEPALQLPWLARLDIGTGCGVPIVHDDEFFGSFCLFFQSNDRPSTGLLEMLTTVGKEIGQFYARTRGVSEIRLRDRAISTATNGIIICDAQADDIPIVYVNRGFEKITGFAADEALGRSCKFLQGPVTNLKQVQTIREALRRQEECCVTIANYRKNGEMFWNDLHISPVEDDNGVVTHFIGVQNDVTARKKIETRLREAEKQAKSASAAKSAFLANISHELRTPLTAILGFADILIGELEDDDTLDAAQTIRRNGDYLLELVNDVLDLSKIEAERMELRREDCDLPELLTDVRKLMEVRAFEHGIPLVLRFDSKIPRVIQTDRVRLRQILVNLLSNAIKFTEEGEVTLVVDFKQRSRVAQDADDHAVQSLSFQVIDTGIGMSEETLAKLFQPFTQADFDVTRRYGGTGLGLSISKRLADRLGGELSAESDLGRGSTFTLKLPITVSTEKLALYDPAEETAVQVEPQPLQLPELSCRVLVVDDRRDVWRVCRFFLEAAGAAVEIAEDGQQALDAVKASIRAQVPFDFVFMDMQMPRMSGYEATRRLREQGFTQPIVALTAGAMRDDRAKCMEVGCSDYFAKPIDGQRLVQVVSSWISGAGKGDDALNDQDSAGQESPANERNFINETEAARRVTAKRVIVVEDSLDVARLMGQVLTRYGHDVRLAHSAQEAREVAKEFQADVCLVDLTLPDHSGLELCGDLRQQLGEHCVMFAVTGHDSEETQRKCEAAGFAAHFTKPINPSQINEAVGSTGTP